MEHIGITINKSTKERVDKYAKERGLNRSEMIRFIINEYLIGQGC